MSQPRGVSPQRRDAWRALAIAIWFGIAAALAERLAYKIVPGYLGPVELWYSALLDLFVFTGLGILAIAITMFARKFHASAIATVLCSILLALDCTTILLPPYHKLWSLIIGLAVGSLLAFLVLRFEVGSSRLARASLAIGLVYGICYLVVLPAWQFIQEHRQIRGAARSSAERPNVIVIVVDALRADHLTTYGYGRPTSPNLDRLASQGVLFENAIAPSSWTLPSHATLLTGRLPSEHHAGESNWYLDNRLPRIESAFQQMGYRTAAFSGNPFLFSRRVGMGLDFSHFEDGSLLEKLSATNLGKHFQNEIARLRLLHNVWGRQNAAIISRNASEWINRSQQPFFTVINYFDVHEPFFPEPGYMQRFSTRQPPPDQFLWPVSVELTPQQVRDEVDSYDACIAYTDEQIATFLHGLEQAGYLKNAIVIITSDHGTSFNEQGFMFHGESLYWEQIHVPLIIYAPGRVPQRTRIAAPVAFQSIPATLMDMLQTPGGSPFPGPSLQALWRDPGAAERWPYPVSELAPQGDTPRFPSYYGPMRSLVTPQWHYIEGGQSGEELYRCCGEEMAACELSQEPERKRAAGVLKNLLDTGRADPAEMVRSQKSTEYAREAVSQGQKKPAANSDTQNAKNRKQMNEQLRALGYAHE